MSVWHTQQPATRTTTSASPGPGFGTSRSFQATASTGYTAGIDPLRAERRAGPIRGDASVGAVASSKRNAAFK